MRKDIVYTMYMSRKKRNLKKICSNISEEAYQMLEQMTNEGQFYLSQTLEDCIRGRYFAVCKSNKLIDFNNKALLRQLQGDISNDANQKTLEDAKAAFIARRNAKKGRTSNVI